MKWLGAKMILSIPDTLSIIIDCWNAAEVDLQKDVRCDYPAVDEEFITQMFHGKFASQLRKASERQQIAKAFLEDLMRAFPDIGHSSELRKLSHGLVADVTLHKRQTEKTTGGDIGFVILRPQVADHRTVLKVGDYRRGLLCQAKIKRRNGDWGKLKENQKKVLSDRLAYLALLLYGYSDRERRELKKFLWQSCNVAQSIDEVADWLKHDHFPSVVSSSNIIEGLGNGKIGTDNNKILDEIVAPVGSTTLEIRIDWPKDDQPGSEIRVYGRHHQKQRNKDYAYVRLGN